MRSNLTMLSAVKTVMHYQPEYFPLSVHLQVSLKFWSTRSLTTDKPSLQAISFRSKRSRAEAPRNTKHPLIMLQSCFLRVLHVNFHHGYSAEARNWSTKVEERASGSFFRLMDSWAVPRACLLCSATLPQLYPGPSVTNTPQWHASSSRLLDSGHFWTSGTTPAKKPRK